MNDVKIMVLDGKTKKRWSSLTPQGDYVVLASEPVCICGVDVAAPQQLRQRGRGRMSVAELKAVFAKQFTPHEVLAAPAMKRTPVALLRRLL
jgi:hypothetical protein